MSTSRRAYDLLRAFVNQERDIFTNREKKGSQSAAEELDEAIEKPWTVPRHEEKQPTELGGQKLPGADPKGRARIILGVTESDDFAAIHKRYESLMKRSAPEKFPAGSEDRFKAERIRRMVSDAYRVLTESMDDTERRFGSLEVE